MTICNNVECSCKQVKTLIITNGIKKVNKIAMCETANCLSKYALQ